jgi:hypothetical protein
LGGGKIIPYGSPDLCKGMKNTRNDKYIGLFLIYLFKRNWVVCRKNMFGICCKCRNKTYNSTKDRKEIKNTLM